MNYLELYSVLLQCLAIMSVLILGTQIGLIVVINENLTIIKERLDKKQDKKDNE